MTPSESSRSGAESYPSGPRSASTSSLSDVAPLATPVLSDAEATRAESILVRSPNPNGSRLRFDEAVSPGPSRTPSMYDVKEFGQSPSLGMGGLHMTPSSSRRRIRKASLSRSPSVAGDMGRFPGPAPGAASAAASTTSLGTYMTVGAARKAAPSTKLRGDVYKPWLEHKDKATRWVAAIFWSLIGVGFAASAVMIYFGYAAIPTTGKLCLVMDDDFSNGINSAYWNYDVQANGFGNGEFEWTTASSNNSFVQDGVLYIVPTLTSDAIGDAAVLDGYTLNLTAAGTCTSSNVSACVSVSNSSTDTIIYPVQSARLSTANKVSIKYGKVEVTARMPVGDWLWPAIWMLPQDSVYGAWPASGEIAIAEARGNNNSYGNLGGDYVTSDLHWGPNSELDAYAKTYVRRQNKIKGYQSEFNTFGLEWTEDYLTTYVNSRVYSVLNLNLAKESFWERGDFPSYWTNGSTEVATTNPWYNGTKAAPFDQSFYLLLNVAVGGTNGWFPDNLDGKPWLDSSVSAMADFYAAKDQWYATWPEDTTKRGMAVKSVKIWQKC
ncbi:hypothetical protein Q5752_006505 [Cryptotrichosporon argae]